MTQENVMVSFVGQKISKICWMNCSSSMDTSTHFITGSWGDGVNAISLWQLPDAGSSDSNTEPSVVSSLPVTGSVTDISFMSHEKLLCTTSTGDLSLVEVDRQNLQELRRWPAMHKYETTNETACCTCVTTNEREVITGGEDGRINVLQLDRKKPFRIIENADSANITGLQFLGTSELVSINTTGQLKLWDIRQNKETPEKVLTLSGNACPLLSVDKHPNQPHILVTGHGDGVIGIWDVRQEKAPVTLIDAHEAEVWQVKFHPLYPDNLFTCSQDASCWFWDGTSMMSGANYIKTMNEASGRFTMTPDDNASSSAWLYIDANKHKMETFSLVPFNKSAVNTFDVTGSTLICGTDNEAVIVVNNIPVR